MVKVLTSYTCSECGHLSVKWYGCCPACQQWDTFILEQPATYASKKKVPTAMSVGTTNLVSLDQVADTENVRYVSGIKEWDRVLGGGIVPGAFMVLTGEPGIGKSTLLLQLAAKLAQQHLVYYFSTEESLPQVKMRAQRLGCMHNQLLFCDKPQFDAVVAAVEAQHPEILILDSLQSCFMSESQALPGTIGQLREIAHYGMRLAKEKQIAIIATGHITKDGVMAGPKTLEHMVDVVLHLHGEESGQMRILRSIKNRFGAVNELGFFDMDYNGMVEVADVNQQLLASVSQCPGSVLVSYLEGSRPLLLEVQALVNVAKFGNPQRVVSGVDYNQVILVAAIIEKYLKIKLSAYDIFIKVSGGVKLRGNSADLAIALSLLSSFFQQALGKKTVALGEVTLSGQIKPVPGIEMHLREAEKFGITDFVLSARQACEKRKDGCFCCSSIYELVQLFNAPSSEV